MIESRVIGTIRSNEPTLVFLHEGLGSASAWRDFPDRLCGAAGHAGILYSRTGYGQSPVFNDPLDADFMHSAASDELCQLLKDHQVNNPVLVGHSDGASIALIYAGLYNDGPGKPLATIVMAPHLFVEPICIEAIEQLRVVYPDNTALQESLARHHQAPKTTFDTWSSAWLSDEFQDWDIREIAKKIESPVLAIQGMDDGYGTMFQIDELERCAPQTQSVRLANCGHSPHRDQTDTVIDAVCRFLRSNLV